MSLLPRAEKPRSGLRRSAAACRSCHHKKTKCDAMLRGRPCSACMADDRSVAECVVVASKRAKKSPVIPRLRTQLGNATPPSCPSRPVQESPLQEPPSIQRQTSDYTTANSVPFTDTLGTSVPSVPDEELTLPVSTLTPRPVEDCASEQSPGCWQPIYIGHTTSNQFSISLTIKDTSGKPTDHNVTICQDIQHPSLCPEDFTYLQAKGVFSIPPIQVCEELLRSYFLHVHVLLPVVNAYKFLTGYVEGGPTNVNLMLLWAVFLAGSHFASPEAVNAAGFMSRIEMSQCYYTRAKKLYDLNHLNDNEASAQSGVLMAYWHPPFKKDASALWKLIGHAIGLCQDLLPRSCQSQSPDVSSKSSCPSIWYRIWWGCVMFDAWGCVTIGRRLRVNQSHSKIPMPSSAEILQELKQLPLSIQYRYLSSHIDRLSNYYTHNLRLGEVIEKFLNKVNMADDNIPTIDEINSWEDDLKHAEGLTRQMVLEDTHSSDKWVKLAAYHYQVCSGGALICILRPHLFGAPRGLAKSDMQSWQSETLRKITAASAQVTSTLEALINLQMLQYRRHWILAPLVAVTHCHLIQMVSEQRLERDLARNKVETCILVLKELEKTNWMVEVNFTVMRSALDHVLAIEQKSSRPKDLLLNGSAENDAQQQFIEAENFVSDAYFGDLPASFPTHLDEFISNGFLGTLPLNDCDFFWHEPISPTCT